MEGNEGKESLKRRSITDLVEGDFLRKMWERFAVQKEWAKGILEEAPKDPVTSIWQLAQGRVGYFAKCQVAE